MRAHPIGHELARHDELERARVGIERAELGRLQPAVEGARAAIAAKAGADRFPGRGSGVSRTARGRRASLDATCPTPCTFWRLPLSHPAGTREACAPVPSRGACRFLCACPPSGITAGASGFES